MPNLGPGEILVILLVALLVFGPRKLPDLGKSLGGALREFRRSTQGLKEDFDGVLRESPAQTQAAQPASQTQVIAAQPQVVTAQAVTPQAVTPQAVTPAPATEPHRG
ncbi:twin-arginine translocase TatA/TatE family subunit [Deinococcus petrolearius]|uniref:Sec-independent protein translocase protein TatA n=1 Tax=Deinococcus petrolearius TaxID=1751295 RepID=A0ABW1DF55_9DEIO